MPTKLLKKPPIIDAFGAILMIFWIFSSVWMLIVDNHDYFQRLGAFGVAVAVLYYSIVRLTQVTPNPLGYAESAHWNRMLSKQASDLAALGVQNASVIAAAIKAERDVEGRSTPTRISLIAKPVLEGNSIVMSDEDWQNFKDVSISVQEKMKVADGVVSSSARSLEVGQLSVLVLATLQWGFGDLFVQWIRS